VETVSRRFQVRILPLAIRGREPRLGSDSNTAARYAINTWIIEGQRPDFMQLGAPQDSSS
jgi:hypothetical protein